MARKALSTKHSWKTLDTLETKVVSETEDLGIVEAWVSTIGVKDSDADIVEPGAYADTLKERTPVVCWGHDRNAYCGKVIAAEEVPAGSKELPATLATKYPQAGSLRVLTEFNLKSTRGRDAFFDVKHRGGEQEWSIGYAVKQGDSEWDAKAGARRIKRLTLFEVSPVLAGASPGTSTGEVKDDDKAYAQVAGSFEDIRQRVQEAVQALVRTLYPQPGYGWAYVEATFPDSVVACVEAPGLPPSTYWQIAYELGEDGTVALGTPEPVEIEATVVPKMASAIAAKEGRMFSSSNMTRMREIADQMEAAAASMRDMMSAAEPPPAKELEPEVTGSDPEGAVVEDSESEPDPEVTDDGLEMLMLLQEQERLRSGV